MLDPEQVDLADLALALEDNSREHSWWFDPVTGRLEPHFVDDIGEVALDEGHADRLIAVEPLPPAVGYGDMQDFVAYVRDPRTRGALERAIAGRGAHHQARRLARVDASERFTEARSLLPVRSRFQIADQLEQLEAKAVARGLDLAALGLDLGPAHDGVLRRRCVAEGGHASPQRVWSARPLHRATAD